MISRFRRGYANRRLNPFTDADLSVDKAENGIVLPTSSPYFVQCLEVPRKDSPTTVTVYNVTNAVWMTEVTGAPGQNQFRVDYPPPTTKGTGIIEFSSLDAGKTVNIAYKATGSPIVTEFLDTFMTRPVSEASEDMYYYDAGEIKRLANAVDVITKKLKAAILAAVDVTSTDAVKDKAINNLLAKGWEDHRGRTDNPHAVTKIQVVLGNVDNIQQATKTEFNAHVARIDNPHTVTKTQVVLGNVDNIQQATKTEFNAHVAATSVHSATAEKTADRIIIRDIAGRAKVEEPSAVSDIATKNYVDSKSFGVTPVGSIIAWVGGYFTGGNNQGYTFVLGTANTVAGANAYLNPLGWFVCDGAALNLAGSPIWMGTGRYLPKLTDNRFIQGANAVGGSGGTNSNLHSHAAGTLAANSGGAHTHGITYTITASGLPSANHTHGLSQHVHSYVLPEFPIGSENTGIPVPDVTIGTSVDHTHGYDKATGIVSDGAHPHTISGATAAGGGENRPLFLSVFYIVRAI